MKSLFVTLLLLSVAFLASSQMVGGYTEVHQDQLAAVRAEDSFVKSEEAARKKFAETHTETLGQLVKVYQQVVAGMNYKMVFETASGQVEIDVFAQPWTETYEASNISRVYNAA